MQKGTYRSINSHHTASKGKMLFSEYQKFPSQMHPGNTCMWHVSNDLLLGSLHRRGILTAIIQDTTCSQGL